MAKKTPAELTALRKQHEAYLNKLDVVIQVRDVDHAREPEVINYCKDFLLGGGRWDELRRRLGLGPAHLDSRWRVIRNLIPDLIMPISEEDALQKQMANQLYLMNELQALIDQAEQGYRTASEKNAHHYLKIKLDAIKQKFEENTRELEGYLEIKKVKQADKKTQGPSIIVQNNYNIARPGQKEEDVRVIDCPE